MSMNTSIQLISDGDRLAPAAVADVGAHAIQGAKDGAPVAGVALGAVALKVAKKRFLK